MANKKAMRYTDEKKEQILDFIEAQGRGGQTKAVKKFGSSGNLVRDFEAEGWV